MRKLIALFALLIAVADANAQAKPAFTQYVLNNYILNPALAGIENYTDIKVGHRQQWTNINGAPITNYVSFHTALNKSDYRTSATSFAVPGENPRGRAFFEEYTAPDPHHGVGFYAMNDRAGYINRWTLNGSYAYHRPISTRTTLSGGFSAGFSAISLDATKATFSNGDTYDPAIGVAQGDLKKVKPELGAGLWLYSARYYVGISALNIVPGKANFSSSDKYGTYFTPNYFLTAGYRVSVGDDFILIPSAMLQYWEPQLIGVHGTLKMQYRDVFWLAGSYRYSDFLGGYSGLAGVNISNTINLSYAYEIATTNRLRTYTGNTHEVLVGFTLGNKYSDRCPTNVF